MTPEQFAELRPGDLVRHKGSSSALIVHANYGARVTAVRTADLTNPAEWDRVDECGQVIHDVGPAALDAVNGRLA
jgi:NMD protein affecting ribosome stability and mRNA decay